MLASIARAGAAVKDRQTYESAWTEAWDLVPELTSAVRAVIPAVLVDLGYAAATLGDWEQANRALSLALETAIERNAHEDAASAEKGLEIVRSRAQVEHPRRPAFGPALHLSNAFVRSLERAAPGVKVSNVTGKTTT